MHTLSDAEFLQWAAEARLVPDPRYPLSRQQLVFASCPDYWSTWHIPNSPGECAEFVRTLIRLSGDAPLRIRLRGGGRFGNSGSDQDQERALTSAVLAAGIPMDMDGGIEFEHGEYGVLHGLALAFLMSGYRVQTDLEIIPSDRRACLMLSHHSELVAQFSSLDQLSRFSEAMTAAGYLDDYDEDADEEA
jgi:hypothetical protein